LLELLCYLTARGRVALKLVFAFHELRGLRRKIGGRISQRLLEGDHDSTYEKLSLSKDVPAGAGAGLFAAAPAQVLIISNVLFSSSEHAENL
jgi:hypothetical protein